jgi:hypothetical protein
LLDRCSGGGLKSQPSCAVLLDRVQAFAWPWMGEVPHIAGFGVCQDFFARQQTTIKTYERVRIYKNHKTKTELYMQRQPACPWLAPFKLTVVANGRTGLERAELENVFKEFRATQFLTVEVAFDFSMMSEVDEAFVRRHGIFGKSHIVLGRPYKALRLGTRHSDTMVRAYSKPEIPSFRVEIQLHGRWLRKHRVQSLDDVSKLRTLLPVARIQFVEIVWASLRAHLLRKEQYSTRTISCAKSYQSSIHRTLGYLRKEGLSNVRRFLRPLKLNETISNALRTWSEGWQKNITKNGGQNA